MLNVRDKNDDFELFLKVVVSNAFAFVDIVANIIASEVVAFVLVGHDRAFAHFFVSVFVPVDGKNFALHFVDVEFFSVPVVGFVFVYFVDFLVDMHDVLV